MATELVTITATNKQYCLFILNKVNEPTKFLPIMESDDPDSLVNAVSSGSIKLEKGQWWHVVDNTTFAIVRDGKI